jgi:predicted DNA-binding transcriptional regulator
MSAQQSEFAARIARIEQGIGSSKTTLYVGLDETYAVKYRQRGQSGKFQMAHNAAYPLTILLAFAVGVLSNAIARLAAFLSQGLPDGGTNLDYLMMMDFVTAMMLSLVIGACLGMNIRNFMAARSLGIVAGMLGLHNAVHLWPDLFARVYSTPWVGYILSTTEPRSLLWRGVSFVF